MEIYQVKRFAARYPETSQKHPRNLPETRCSSFRDGKLARQAGLLTRCHSKFSSYKKIYLLGIRPLWLCEQALIPRLQPGLAGREARV